jgi:hypothetical protein
MDKNLNENNSLEYYLQNGLEYKSVINRVFVRQSGTNKYSLTLKPKILVLDIFPSFSYIELQLKENKAIKTIYHYHIIVYFVFVLMSVVMFFMMISVDYSYGVFLIIWSALVVIFKFYGYKELRKIDQKLRTGL